MIDDLQKFGSGGWSWWWDNMYYYTDENGLGLWVTSSKYGAQSEMLLTRNQVSVPAGEKEARLYIRKWLARPYAKH